MAYFNELPNLEVVSRFPNQSSNQDYTTIKNIWRRPKLRQDIANAITAFNYYQIKDGERPDQIAEKVYGDPELDWVILITNNIINLNEEWPLDNNSFYNYLIEKYGTEEKLQEIHHTETIEQRDEFNRVVVPKGLQVDNSLTSLNEFTTNDTDTSYILDEFPPSSVTTSLNINLAQALSISKRADDPIKQIIPDINVETSTLKIKTRNNSEVNININNDLVNFWPSGWGGSLRVYSRAGTVSIISIEDILTDLEIKIPSNLYEIVGELIDGNVVPKLTFIYKSST